MGKSLLIITDLFPYASPGRTVRLAKRIKLLEDRGWHTTVLTTPALEASLNRQFREYAPASTIVRYVRDWAGRLRRRHYRGLWVAPANVRRSGGVPGGWRRAPTATLRNVYRWAAPDYWTMYLPSATLRARQLIKQGRFDVMVSTSSPHSAHMVAYLATLGTKIPWVAEFRDPWSNHVALVNKRLRRRLARSLEKTLLRRASAILLYEGWFPQGASHFEGMGSGYKQRTHVLPRPGFDPDDFSGGGGRETPGRLTITHYGNFYPGKCNLRPFFEGLAYFCASTPGAADGLRVRLIGNLYESVWKVLQDTGSDTLVEVVGELPHQRGVDYLQESSYGLWIGSDSDVENVPGKVFDYIGAGIPVLAIGHEGPAIEFIREKGLGCVVTPNEPIEVANAIAGLYRDFKDGGNVTIPRKKAMKFSLVQTERQFAQVLDGVRRTGQPAE